MPRRYDWVTFDCYGTLIDWEAGMRAFLREAGVGPSKIEQVRHRWEEEQKRLERNGPYKSYSDILIESVRTAAPEIGDRAKDAPHHLTTWRPFPDVADALPKIREHAKIGIISNTDRALLAKTVERIGVSFDDFVTAEDARVYKPDPKIFERALKAFKTKPDRVLHVSVTFEYDLIPAAMLGFCTAWINRGGDEPTDSEVEFTAKSIAELPELLASVE